MMAVWHQATREGVEEEVAPARARQAERQVGTRIGRVPAAVVVVHVLPGVGGMERQERGEQEEEQQRHREGREPAPRVRAGSYHRSSQAGGITRPRRSGTTSTTAPVTSPKVRAASRSRTPRGALATRTSSVVTRAPPGWPPSTAGIPAGATSRSSIWFARKKRSRSRALASTPHAA